MHCTDKSPNYTQSLSLSVCIAQYALYGGLLYRVRVWTVLLPLLSVVLEKTELTLLLRSTHGIRLCIKELCAHSKYKRRTQKRNKKRDTHTKRVEREKIGKKNIYKKKRGKVFQHFSSGRIDRAAATDRQSALDVN